MRAIILAAGAGTRLRHLTTTRPKCLVPVGGRPLLDRQLQGLQAAGVDEVVLVVGFEADQVRRHGGPEITYVVNETWASTNSIYSLYRALPWLRGPSFLFNCDVLFHPEVLQRLAAVGSSAIAVDGGAARLPGEMNVRLDADGRVRAISKRLDPATTQAVSVQLARFDAHGAAQVAAEVERLVHDDVKDAFPTSAYGPVVEAGALRAVEVGDLPWAEIDSVEDLEMAEREVAPRLP